MANTAPTGAARKNRKGRARPGRPSYLDQQVGTRPDGTPILAIDRVTETMRLGGSIEDAAARAGIARQTFYLWTRKGVRLQAALSVGHRTDADLTDEEREVLRFLVAVEEARAAGKLLLLGLNDQLARGGIPVTTTTEKTERQPDGTFRVVERTVKREETLPDGAAIRWRLERSFPQEFGRRVEVTGADGAPLVPQQSAGERAEGLADQLRAYLVGKADAEKAAKQVAR